MFQWVVYTSLVKSFDEPSLDAKYQICDMGTISDSVFKDCMSKEHPCVKFGMFLLNASILT